MSRDKKGYIAGEDVELVDDWQPPAMQDKAINQDAIDRLRRARRLVEKRQQERIKAAQIQVEHAVELRTVPEYNGPQKQQYLDPVASQKKNSPSAISQLTEEQILQVEAKYQAQNNEALDNLATDGLNTDKPSQGSQKTDEPSDEERLQAELQQLKEQAHQEGYEAGLLQAESEAKKQLEIDQQSLQQKSELIENLIGQLKNRVEKVDLEVENEIVTLIKLFVKQIIKREIQLDPTHLISLLRDAIQVLPMSINQNIIVDMHPHEAEVVGDVLHIDSENGTWKIKANPTLESGAMRLTMGDSTIDASVEKQIQYLISQAFDVRNKPEGKPKEAQSSQPLTNHSTQPVQEDSPDSTPDEPINSKLIDEEIKVSIDDPEAPEKILKEPLESEKLINDEPHMEDAGKEEAGAEEVGLEENDSKDAGNV
jgi:flagellar assembly protein FliH